MSWYDLQNHSPRNPFDVVEFAALDSIPGSFEYSSDFLTGGTAFVTTPLTLGSTASVEAWEADNLQYVGDADMWTQQHKMVDVSNGVPPPMHKMAFLRGGHRWKNNLELEVGLGVDFILLSFLDNGGTRGDAQGQIPVIRFDNGGSGIAAGTHLLTLTVKRHGEMSMGLKTTAASSGDQAMMEMDWVVV